MAEKEYIEREAVLTLLEDDREVCADSKEELKYIRADIRSIPAADVRPVVVCADCKHNNHCLTQEFVDDCGKIPLDRNTFF